MQNPIFKQAFITGFTAVISLWVAQRLKLPQGYWAVMSSLVVLQTDAEGTIRASWVRVAGTAVGAVIGGVFFAAFGPRIWAFAAAVVAAVLLCTFLRLAESYRLAAVTVTAIMLGPHLEAAGLVAWHRFIEVSLGIIVSLLITAMLYPSLTYQILRQKFLHVLGRK